MPEQNIVFFGIKYFPSRGGTSRVAENLILELKGKYNLTIFCYRNPDAENHIAGVKAIQLPHLFPGALGAFVFYFFSTLILLFSFKKYHLIHAHKTDCAFFIPILRLRYKVLATSHEAPYKRDKWNRLMKFYFQVVERIFVRFATKATCISESLTRYYNNKYKSDVLFIPNGVNPALESNYNYTSVQGMLPEGASLDAPFVLFAARRLMSTKGAHTMLKALKRINYTGQIFIAGEIEKGSKYLTTLEKLSKGLDVYFLGFISPLSSLLALVDKCELFIFPSETEGMSIMLLEVASVGKPIIASDIPENTDVFSNEEMEYFINKDFLSLADKIQNYLFDSTLVKRKTQLAKAKVESKYNWQNISEEYAKEYHSLFK